MGLVIGIDEAGRGSWAGPLVVALVILKKPIDGLNDSKKLSKPKRQKMFDIISRQALEIKIALAHSWEIDSLGLTLAESKAIKAALKQIQLNYSEIIIDGKYNFLADNPLAKAVVKADELIPTVSAASIIAKVTRDNFMTQQALIYPNYKFEVHKGYGTALHKQKLEIYGPSRIHRFSYKPVSLIHRNQKLVS